MLATISDFRESCDMRKTKYLEFLQIPYGSDGTNKRWGSYINDGIYYDYIYFSLPTQLFVLTVAFDGRLDFNSVEAVYSVAQLVILEKCIVYTKDNYIFWGVVYELITFHLQIQLVYIDITSPRFNQLYNMFRYNPIRSELAKYGFECSVDGDYLVFTAEYIERLDHLN
jgi:hypothetical protein